MCEYQEEMKGHSQLTGSPMVDENFRESETFTLASMVVYNPALCLWIEYLLSNVVLERNGLAGLR